MKIKLGEATITGTQLKAAIAALVSLLGGIGWYVDNRSSTHVKSGVDVILHRIDTLDAEVSSELQDHWRSITRLEIQLAAETRYLRTLRGGEGIPLTAEARSMRAFDVAMDEAEPP